MKFPKLDTRRRDDPRGALARRDLLGVKARVNAMRTAAEIDPGRTRALLGYLIGGIGIAVALTVTGISINRVDRTAAELAVEVETGRLSDVRECRRVNVQNAYERLDSTNTPRRKRLATALFPIVNCEALSVPNHRSRSPEGIPLEPWEARRYIRVIAAGRLPIVKEGRVIGSLPYPPAGPSGGDLPKQFYEKRRQQHREP